MTYKPPFIVAFLTLLSTVPFASKADAQDRRATIRGTVTTDSGNVIVGADIIVTIAPTRDSRATKTDSSGRYSMALTGGTGDYLVHISAPGFDPFRKRVTLAGDDSTFIVDAKLARVDAQELSTVSVTAEKPLPDRGVDMYGHGVGGSDDIAGGVNGAVSPDQAGDLIALGATIPGVAVTANGLSVAGLGPGQNSTTLNGMAFGGSAIPRDAYTSVRVSRTAYDPSLGWFGGLNEDVSMPRGGVFASRQGHITIDAPALQFTDPISSELGQRFSNVIGSFGGEGSVDEEKYTYSYGAQANRRTSHMVSLSDASANLLQHAGVSSDSVAQLLNTLSTKGIPTQSPAVPRTDVSQGASFIGRLDHAPYDWDKFRRASTTWGMLGFGAISSDNTVGLAPTSVATRGASRSQATGMLQALFSTYIHGDYLNEERSGVTFSRTKSEPYLALPSGRVLVASSFPDGTGGLASLGFGGDASTLNDTRQWTWETTSETQFYANGREAHKIKLNADTRFDATSQRASSNALGTFAFNSLNDVITDQPVSFTRSLATPSLSGAVWNGFIAASDVWRVAPTFQIMYGVRVEGNHYTMTPTFNPLVQTAFNLRTDNAPNTFHASPRIGFTWVRAPDYGSVQFTQLGQLPRPRTSNIHGGVGEFRNILPASLLTNASVSTGLPNGARSLTCVGDAVPATDFAQYLSDPTSIPTQCLGGAPPAFVDAAPAVQLFAPNYTAPRSWRGNLGYASSYKILGYSIEGLYSLNLNQPGRSDVNFSGVKRFTLQDDGRPIFVDPGDIVAASGAVATAQARVSPLFGHVIENVSNLTSRSKQVTVSLTPMLSRMSNWFLTANYTLGNTRALETGFDGSTFGNPNAREWARGDFDIRHQVLLQGGYSFKTVSLTFFGRLQSGLPFTPMIGGDVNGDGLANDRAFIFDPATLTDVSIASATTTLLSSSSQDVRDCLTRQMGHAAARNSCEGPWTTALNAELSYSGTMPITHQPGSISLAFANPLGGLDQALHGANHLHGWGTAAYPDPLLYTPTGFDATSDRFKYVINPRFGNTNPNNVLLRSPFRVTLDVRLILGRPLPQQQINRWIKPGRGGRKGPKLSAVELERRYARSVPDPYPAILQQSDSLLLTRDQMEALQAADKGYLQRVDSVWTELSEYLASLPDQYSTAEALRRQEAAVADGWELTKLDVQRTLPTILSLIQLRLLPGEAAYLMKTKGKVGLRIAGF